MSIELTDLPAFDPDLFAIDPNAKAGPFTDISSKFTYESKFNYIGGKIFYIEDYPWIKKLRQGTNAPMSQTPEEYDKLIDKLQKDIEAYQKEDEEMSEALAQKLTEQTGKPVTKEQAEVLRKGMYTKNPYLPDSVVQAVHEGKVVILTQGKQDEDR